MRRILIITDAAEPQINGVVRTLKSTIDEINKRKDYDVFMITPADFKVINFPKWLRIEQEISFAYNIEKKLAKMIAGYDPEFIHIAVEGLLGIAARKYCLKNDLKFTTAYHTKFPEYLWHRFWIPTFLGYAYMRWFHKHSSTVMVATKSLEKSLIEHGFTNVFKHWSRGVDIELFNPEKRFTRAKIIKEPKYALTVGRVSHEKNVEEFLKADIGNILKVVIGDGPIKNKLEKKYKNKNVTFLGTKTGDELAWCYANADVFVFPSKSDTFGLVLIEALASGTPVVGYDVPSPCDIITDEVGILSKKNNLSDAITEAMTKDRTKCRELVENNYTWEIATNQFIENLVPIR